MRLAVTRSAVLVRAPAKINLFLEILGKRPDGYHDIATLMVAIRLFDTLVFQVKDPGSITLDCASPGLSTADDNLIVRAARLLQERSGCRQGARIRLKKRIPLAAGLAGGSSDAAATLAGLNQLWRLGLSDAALAELSQELGSDVPFFFHTPCAWCTGRGEKAERLALGRTLDVVLVKPPVGLSTAAVYRDVAVPEKPLTGAEICAVLAAGDVEALGRLLHNRLEEPALALCPEVGRCLERLRQKGPAGQLMSGSGSTVFALCRGRGEAEELARELRPWAEQKGSHVFLVRSCSS